MLGALGLNLIGSRVVDRAQSAIVLTELAVFVVFIVVTFTDIDLSRLAFSGYPSFSSIIASVALTFFAFLGFSVITFSVGDLADPARGLPDRDVHRARGDGLPVRPGLDRRIRNAARGRRHSLRPDRDRRSGPSRARRRRIHDDGPGGRLGDRRLDERDALRVRRIDPHADGGGPVPAIFGRSSRLGEHGGLFITAGLIFVVANLVDLSAIASVGSAIALALFVFVAFAGYRRCADTARTSSITVAAIVASVLARPLRVDTLRNDPKTFVAILALTLLAVVLERTWQGRRRRRPSAPPVADSYAEQPVTRTG